MSIQIAAIYQYVTASITRYRLEHQIPREKLAGFAGTTETYIAAVEDNDSPQVYTLDNLNDIAYGLKESIYRFLPPGDPAPLDYVQKNIPSANAVGETEKVDSDR